MTAYYNEIDPFAAAWLRELIKAGHIAPGDVDERSIEDVCPADLAPYGQCHFFAGIGVWSYALRRIGWPDDRRIWSGSCPCQPFSAAGKSAGFADERHLWPAFFHLITQCRPGVVVGEQVASRDGLGWLDLVQADLEGADYASGAVDTCAAGFGAPHIRQRLYWVAYNDDDGRTSSSGARFRDPKHYFEPCGRSDGVEHARSDGWQQRRPEPSGRGATSGCGPGGLADHGGSRLEGRDKRSMGVERPAIERDCHREPTQPPAARPTNGHWRDADWLFCRDGKWRPVEPGTFPLAHGAPARVGRLRGYGNGLVAEQAEAFLAAALT